MLCNSLRNKIIKIALIATMAITVVAAPLVATYATPSVSAATSLNELKQKQEDIKKQQQETSAKLDSLKADQAKQQEYKDTLDAQLVNVKQEKYVIQERINTLDAEINAKETEIADKQKEIDANFEQLGKRLNAIYLAGETTTLEILLQSDNATDLMDNMEVVQSVTEHDKKLIENLKTSLSEIKDQKAQIESDRKEVAAAKVELDQKQSEINALVEESKRVIAEIGSSIDETNHAMHELDEKSEKAAAEIDQWFADYYADLKRQQAIKDQIQQSQKNNAPNGTGSTNGGSAGNGNTNQGNTGGSGGGISGGVSSSGWMWPAPGVHGITSDFWDGRNHGALDIATPGCAGSTIVASRSGVVIQVNSDSWGGGYGNYAFIDHGDGYVTVYAHMSSRIVNSGQYVNQGQVLGYIGNTGNSFGAHLHFEIRKNGVKVDPSAYIKG